MTITLECPWCDAHVALQEADESVACDACGIVADIATDEVTILVAAA
jgi:hypothetical protein